MMNKLNILVADDELAICKFLQSSLKKQGYETIIARDGKTALEAFGNNKIDLIILDIMMPGCDGFEVCRQIREWSEVPIIMLSARDDESDKIKCLEMGADDYLTKPFSTGELIARIQTALRHHDNSGKDVQTCLTLGDIEINFAKRIVTAHGSPVRLTKTEYSILVQLVINKNKTLTHTMLLQKVWGGNYYNEKEYLRVFVGRLRKKLGDDCQNPKYIINVPGVGYYMNSTS
jgi:two-component system, OmpR family, KDP operon response regulator KdpE